MTNQEINEYLAEHLFGLKKGVDFGNLHEHIRQSNSYCTNCGFLRVHDDESIECYVNAPNYIENYHLVLNKLWLLRCPDTDCFGKQICGDYPYEIIIGGTLGATTYCRISYWRKNTGKKVTAKKRNIIGSRVDKESVGTLGRDGHHNNIGFCVCKATVEYLQNNRTTDLS